MKHLFEHWNELSGQIQNCYLMLFLDYDGTLTPIRDKPEQAKLLTSHRKTLNDLVKLEGVCVSIVSGRSISDVKKLVDVSGIIYVGNHGLEIKGPRIDYKHPDALIKEKTLAEIAAELKKTLKIRGVIIENKKFSLSVHYRMVGHDKIESAKSSFLKIVTPYVDRKLVKLTEGKKVWEVRPEIVWNKGAAVLWLIARLMANTNKKAFPIYIGDDRTDEDALEVLAKNGMGIRVTSKLDETTHAEYFLTTSNEVFDFLKRIKNLRTIKESAIKHYARTRNA